MDSSVSSSDTGLRYPTSATIVIQSSSHTSDHRHTNSLNAVNVEPVSKSENSVDVGSQAFPDPTSTESQGKPTSDLAAIFNWKHPLYTSDATYPPSPSSLALPPSFDLQSWNPDTQMISNLETLSSLNVPPDLDPRSPRVDNQIFSEPQTPSSLSVPPDLDPRSPRLESQIINGIHSLYALTP